MNTNPVPAESTTKTGAAKPCACCGGLLRRRECWVPTWRGWLLLLLLSVVLVLIVGPRTYGFLALHDPVPGGVLVVEGWAPDYAMRAAIVEMKRYSYRQVFVTGGPIERGSPLCEYKTAAELGAVILVRMGLKTNEVVAVPSPLVVKDRTYTSALALKKWLKDRGIKETRVNVLSVGPHSRRSRLLFEKALGDEYQVGVIALESRDFDSAHWWKYSGSVRGVIDETIAYIYARFLFYPAKE
ncbi:MAG: ElyC/SanA/YdcF family protein [Verrucomicrobiota bacterium]